MTLEHNPNHAEHGVLKFAAPFWGKPRWAALFVAIARQIQELEDVFWDILEKRTIENATGVQLAVLGGLVGQIDPGLGEDIFRNLIRARIRINRSRATRDDLIEVLQLLGIPKGNRSLNNLPPRAAMLLEMFGTIPLKLQLLHSTLSEAMSAGVGLVALHSTTPSFVFTNATSAPGTRGAWANAASGGAPWANVAGPNPIGEVESWIL